MSYQPFLIAPFGSGLDLDDEPWIAPQDAFSVINDAHIHNGFIEKREGYRKYGDLVQSNGSDWDISNISGDTVTVTDASGLMQGDEIVMRNVSSTTDINNTIYTIASVASPNIVLTGLSDPGYSSDGEVYLIPRNRVMGIYHYIDSSNVKELLCFDTKRAYIFNTGTDQFDPLDTSDIFSGSDTNYIWAENWASTSSSTASTLFRLYFTNGKSNGGGSTDGMHYYDPASSTTTTTQFNPDINGSVEIRGCKLIFAFKQRMLLLNTFEDANQYPQRARWCQINNPTATDGWDDNVAGKGGYVDAPTGDHIISAQFMNDMLIVYFTNSIWTLRPVPNPALPFRWDKINDFRACGGKMATTGYDRAVIASGIRGITATDGVRTERIDNRIELFVKERIEANEFDKTFLKRSYANKRTWMLYTPSGDDDTDDDDNAALIFDEDSGAFSVYNIGMNVLGYGGAALDLKLSDFPDDEEEAAISELPLNLDDAGDIQINDYVTDENEEIFLGGDRNGTIYILEEGDNDAGASIGFELESSAWNPFKEQGTLCQFGYIDLFIETNDQTKLTVKFYKDNEPTQYKTTTVNCLPDINEVAEVSNITKKSPATAGITVVAHDHGLTDGDNRYIYGVDGMESINGGPYEISLVDANTFDISVDSTDFDAYVNGGVITELESYSRKVWKRVYAGGTGYQHKINITSSGVGKPVKIYAFMPWFRKKGRRMI